MIEAPLASNLRRQLLDGSVIGTFLKVPSIEVVDLVKITGYDLAVVDLEHSQLSEREARLLVRHGYDIGLPTVVRVPDVDRGQVNRLLEAGAVGIQLSTTRRRQQIDDLETACRYPPDGERSISLTQVRAGFGSTGLAEFISAQRDDPPLLVGQVETATTDEPLATIFSARLDVVFIGTADLSVSAGAPGDLMERSVRTRLDEIAAAAESTGVVLGGYAGSAATIELLLGLGARYLMVGSDVGALTASLKGALSDARSVVDKAAIVERGEL